MGQEESNILFHITLDQAEVIAKHFGKNLSDLEEYDICEMLDEVISQLD